MKFLTTDTLLAVVTEQLMKNGLDYEVTLEGSGTTVKLTDDMTGATLATSKKETLEEALMTVLAQAASRSGGSQGLSIL